MTSAVRPEHSAALGGFRGSSIAVFGCCNRLKPQCVRECQKHPRKFASQNVWYRGMPKPLSPCSFCIDVCRNIAARKIQSFRQARKQLKVRRAAVKAEWKRLEEQSEREARDIAAAMVHGAWKSSASPQKAASKGQRQRLEEQSEAETHHIAAEMVQSAWRRSRSRSRTPTSTGVAMACQLLLHG